LFLVPVFWFFVPEFLSAFNFQLSTFCFLLSSMHMTIRTEPLAERVSDILADFVGWLDGFGETSWDHQSFFAGPVGGRAKALYYRHRLHQ
jgi:hypothetical protein